MNLRHYLLILIALGVGFLAGRKTAPSAETSSAGVSADGDHRSERSRAATLSSHEDGGAPTRPNRPRPREDKKLAGNGPEVALPLELLTKDLRERQLSHMNFSYLDTNIDGPLKLLGANDDERQQVKAVLSGMKEEIYAAEKQHLKVLKSDTTVVLLDATGMKAALPAIMEATQTRIRDATPQRLGEAINASINWDGLYDMTGKFEPVKLQIVKGPGGAIIAQYRFNGGGTGFHLNEEDIPPDGSLIQADRHFESRWAPFLKGVMLEPVDPTD
ncbi:hypothetical protein OVA24_01655 [Luteolibacter sp. SL250]|uniref:hypothetical protein n=1 Tax=Luteolibacter sp. SL250 TaxID=2995170 RepID=UPI00226E2D91|nr:hypothetical protein [Luteolibacter sp. SL250]WAC20082.1 hypothetical protein OVA24_01655 [Luteolibacter sp. SL250]